MNRNQEEAIICILISKFRVYFLEFTLEVLHDSGDILTPMKVAQVLALDDADQLQIRLSKVEQLFDYIIAKYIHTRPVFLCVAKV